VNRTTCAILVAAAIGATAPARAAVSDLRIEQPLRKGDRAHRAPPAARIRFRLTEPAEVTVRIDRHKATVGSQGWFADRERTVSEIHTVRVRVEK